EANHIAGKIEQRGDPGPELNDRGRRRPRIAPAEKHRHDFQVSGGADRDEFGEALNEAENDGLNNRHQRAFTLNAECRMQNAECRMKKFDKISFSILHSMAHTTSPRSREESSASGPCSSGNSASARRAATPATLPNRAAPPAVYPQACQRPCRALHRAFPDWHRHGPARG